MNNKVPIEQLRTLGLHGLAENWNLIIKKANENKPSYHRFLVETLTEEYHNSVERARLARLKRAKIPEMWVMETFPFRKQHRLKRQMVMQLYDSMQFLTDSQDLLFIGPTGCGKTGLATSFFVHAINQGYRGLFIDFSDLVNSLYRARGDHSESRLLKRLASYQVLLIDELGYLSCDKEKASLFFDLMRRRHRRSTTILTTQLGFDEWGSFLHDPHLTAALLDRITVNCAVFNMKDCISIRPKKILYATRRQAETKTQTQDDAAQDQ
jgi:DNA replication protein DnaC